MEQNYVFEVLAREGHRVDKVLVLTTKTAGTNPKSADAVDSSDALNVHPPSARCRNPGPRPNLATPRQQRDRAGASIRSEKNCAQRNSRTFRASLRAQDPSPTKGTQAERDGAGASFGSEHPNLWREAPRLSLPELPCERSTHPQQKVRRRSGMGPERALEANTKKNCAQRNGGSF